MFEVDEKLKAMAATVMEERKDLKKLAVPECRIVYLYSDNAKKSRGRAVYADTEKVSDKVKAIAPYDFIVTFYSPNCDLLDDEKNGDSDVP